MSAQRIADWIAGVVGLHRIGPQSGIFAALAALPLCWLLHWLAGFPLVALATVMGALKVLWAAPRAGVPMIADRMIGQFLALWPLSGGLSAAGVDPTIFPWPGWVGGFLACQAFTLFLPPVKRLSRFGPLWDDLAAGALAAILVLVAAWVAHGGLG